MIKTKLLHKYAKFLDIFVVTNTGKYLIDENGDKVLNCTRDEAIQLLYSYLDLRRPYLTKRRNPYTRRRITGL